MTAPAITAPACPKCGSDMWDNRVGKKNPKAPDWKCKDKACDGVIWPPRATAAPKSAPAKQPISYSSVADKDLPEFLRSQESEDNAALAAKIGVDLSGIQKDLAIYQAQTEFVLREIAPLYEKAGVGMSPESAAACVQTLFINSTGGRK